MTWPNKTASDHHVNFSIDIQMIDHTCKVTETSEIVTFPVETWSTEGAEAFLKTENTTSHRFPKFGHLIRTIWRAFSDIVTISSVLYDQHVLSLNGWSVLLLEFWSLG